jgi:hypothetical protein
MEPRPAAISPISGRLLRGSQNSSGGWAWWSTFVIPVLGRWREEEQEFKVSLGYIVRSCLKKKKGSWGHWNKEWGGLGRA